MFENFVQGIIIRTILAYLNNKQPPTQVRSYNLTVLKIVNDTIAEVRSITMDICFHFFGTECYKVNSLYIKTKEQTI